MEELIAMVYCKPREETFMLYGVDDHPVRAEVGYLDGRSHVYSLSLVISPEESEEFIDHAALDTIYSLVDTKLSEPPNEPLKVAFLTTYSGALDYVIFRVNGCLQPYLATEVE